MNEVAETDLEELWACASTEALQRTVDLARKVLKAQAARIVSADDRTVQCASDPQQILTAPLSDNAAISPDMTSFSLDAPIRLPSIDRIGVLSVLVQEARVWSDEDRELLGEFAACLAGHIELKRESVQRAKAERALSATSAKLLAVADRIPGLVFERRKVDAARSSYTFFGAAKTQLPAVRQMMEDGGAGALNFVHRDDRDLVRSALLRSNLEETDLDLTFRIKDLDRSVRWLRSQSIVRRDAEGGVLWDGLIFDITDLVAAREEAEAARGLRDKLLVDIGGEMRAPLEAIIGFADVLAAERQQEHAATQARSIRLAAESLLATVGQLPTRAGAEAPPPPAASPPSDIRSAAPQHRIGTHILLADDLDLNRRLIADMLSLEGHRVDAVADGAAALEAARRQRYDLILMDMIMPGMDGLAATRAIRALPAPTCNVPILALTAHSLDEQLDACLDAGMDATLTKPMSIDALNEAVATWIRGRKAA